MVDERRILAQPVAERLEALGRSARDVSLAAIGKPDLVRDIKREKRMPTAPAMIALAGELETTVDWLLGRTENSDQPVSEVSFREMPAAWRDPSAGGIPLLGTGYCDDLHIDDETGGFDVERVQIETDHVIRMLHRPAALWAAKDAYAIYFHGTSMEPRFYPGEIGIVDPRRPPGPGDFVVAQLSNGSDDAVMTVLVKQLVRQTSTHVELAQFNPARSFSVPRRMVARLHRIFPPSELLF